MALRPFNSIPYIPFLGLRPAEVQALEELPQIDKRTMMPLIQIGPWTTAHHLHSAISRWEEAYGDLPCFVSLADNEPPAIERPAHVQLAELRNPEGGYSAWCQFVESKNHFVPTLQLAQPMHLSAQGDRLYRLGRGLMIVVERGGFPGIELLSQTVSLFSNNGVDVCFMLDIGRATRDLIMQTLQIQQYIQDIFKHCPKAFVSVSASSFPEAFTSITSQEIFERTLFNSLRAVVGEKLIYSDRGSARAERQSGGGGTPAPRIDYATSAKWLFFRSDEESDRNAAYFKQANLAMKSPEWDANLRIWGTQMIERTAVSDTSAIVSPKRSTAARINIHLHRQTFYGDEQRLYDTDDTWTD